MRDVHIILTLNQNEDEEDPIKNPGEQRLRIHLAGGRRMRMKTTTRTLIDKSRCQIREDDSAVSDAVDDTDPTGIHL